MRVHLRKIGLPFVLIATLFTHISAQEDQPTWRPVIRQMEKAERHVNRFVSRDTLLDRDDYSLYLRWQDLPGKPYLLLIHGMGLNGATMWKNQAEDLSQKYNLIIPDLVGYGKSQMKVANYAPEFQVHALFEALRALRIDGELHVLGFSYGGLVAALSKTLYAEQVDRMIICDAPVKFFTKSVADSMAKQAGLDSIQQIIVPQSVDEARKMLIVMTARKVRAPRRVLERVRQNVFALNSDVKYGQMRHLENTAEYYTTLDYALDGASTSFFWGTEDGVIPPLVGQQLHALYPQSTLHLFEGGKHDIHVFDEKRFNALVVQELSK